MDLTLDQAIEQTVTNNTSLRTADLETREAARDLAANRTKRWASMQFTGLGGELVTKPTITFRAGDLGTFPATGPIPATNQTITIPREPVGIFTISVSQPLSTLYKLQLQLRAQSLGVEGKREDQCKKLLDTVDQVRRAYYQVVEAQSKLDSSDASLPLYRESKRLADENRQRETILESDRLSADAQLLQAENAASDARDQLVSAEEQLNDLMGRDIHTQFRVADVQEIPSDAETAEAIEARALQNRPDLKKARLKVAQADYDRRAKQAEYIPEVSGSFSYFTTVNFGNIQPTDIGTLGLQVTWEPWDWGRKHQELAGKRLLEEEAQVSVIATERTVLLDVRNALRQEESAKRQLALSELNQQAKRQKLHETQEQFKREAVLSKDLFSAQSDVASADSQQQQALSAFWKARADLKKATGEQ